MDLHRIPNVEFGSYGERSSVRLFFPDLYSKDRDSGSSLTQEEQRIVYNDGLCPAMHDLMEHAANDWPPTYADELFRAQKRNGSYSFTTKGVPGYLLSPLGDLIRQKLSNAGHAWGNSMRFLLQVRGIKHTTQHQLDEDAAELAFQELFRELGIHYPPWNDIDADADDLWFADIGVEITSERGDCLQWRTDRHAQVVKHALQISEANATRITSLGSGEYERDVVAHLLQVSECRIKTGSRSQGFYRARYVQLYTTDKALTYSPEGGHYGKFMQVSDALTKNQPPTFTTKLRQLYIHAMDRNASHCRIELRVPLARGTKVLLNFPRHLLESSMVSFPKLVWW